MSKLGKLGHFFQQVAKVAPLILAVSPLAPIAGPITAAIQEAEAIQGASGKDKLAHVVAIAIDAAQTANAAAGHVVVDPAAVESTAGAVISAVVESVNLAKSPAGHA